MSVLCRKKVPPRTVRNLVSGRTVRMTRTWLEYGTSFFVEVLVRYTARLEPLPPVLSQTERERKPNKSSLHSNNLVVQEV